MAVEKRNTWFKIAANPKGIKEKLAHHWRCFIMPENKVITMKTFTLDGRTSSDNCIPGSTDEEGADPRAWIAMYGNVSISEDGKGTFLLKEPVPAHLA